MNPDKTIDVFLSFNSKAREIVEQIAVYLEDQADLRVWFDEWQLIPGESTIKNLERGLKAARTCALFVGADGQGPWQRKELEAAIRRQIQNDDFRVIPVLLPDAPPKERAPELPAFLATNTWVEFGEGLGDPAMWQLECGIRGQAPGRGRPPQGTRPPVPVASMPMDLEIRPTSRSTYVFISYRHQEPDSGLAQICAAALRRAGHQVFIDTGVTWGREWAQEIQAALQRCEYLLPLLSAESVRSDMVVEEVKIAAELAQNNQGIPRLLPVRVRFPFGQALPYVPAALLDKIQQREWRDDQDTAPLLGELLEVLEQREAWPETSSPTPGMTVHTRQTDKPMPQCDPRRLTEPGGALDTDARFYIRRPADQLVWDGVQRDRALLTLQGARQSGKTSLIARVHTAVLGGEPTLRSVFVDVQAIPLESLQSLEAVWCYLAEEIATQLELSFDWRGEGNHERGFHRFLKDRVFAQGDTSLLICLDEVNRFFSTDLHKEFFASLRACCSKGAFDPVWKKVRWLLGTSYDPVFFIEDLTQSPFNIGRPVRLDNFDVAQVAEFARHLGMSLPAGKAEEIVTYVGGRPYLVHLLLYHLAREPGTRGDLFDGASAGHGIFRDHLHYYLIHLEQEDALAEAMGELLADHQVAIRLAKHLEAAGLAYQDKGGQYRPACRLYAEFFGKALTQR
ncbi:AAA-like domain-containing protein [Candidatus Thiosymbion oneisti]|uniref:AAA-like domain-containing protein n=1 Tax=Candidatus Thiosymbion oneisti TaxID=589554 RepID=UPI000AA4470D|nr:AAA-like domain-containing protein [Candidatus Thiosymbion oneisti]